MMALVRGFALPIAFVWIIVCGVQRFRRDQEGGCSACGSFDFEDCEIVRVCKWCGKPEEA